MYIVIETQDLHDGKAHGPFATEQEATEYMTMLAGEDEETKKHYRWRGTVTTLTKPFANC